MKKLIDVLTNTGDNDKEQSKIIPNQSRRRVTRPSGDEIMDI